MWPTPSLEIPNLGAMSFCFIKWFSRIISSMLCWWDLPVGVTDFPELAVSRKLASPTSCLNRCTPCLTVLTSTHLPPTLPACSDKCQWEEFFSTVKNWIMAHWTKYPHSLPFWLALNWSYGYLWVEGYVCWRGDTKWMRGTGFIQFSLLH